jgi:hypothetical protein
LAFVIFVSNQHKYWKKETIPFPTPNQGFDEDIPEFLTGFRSEAALTGMDATSLR